MQIPTRRISQNNVLNENKKPKLNADLNDDYEAI